MKRLLVKHKIVSPNCQNIHGITSAGMKAADEIQKAYEEFARFKDNKGATFHFKLFMDKGPK